jgi:predicted glycosyltransferase
MSGVLFQVRNRRGLGHLMRAANIAAALSSRSDAPRLVFHLAAPPPDGLWSESWHITIESVRPWADVVADVAPDVVVFDTVLPDDPTRNVPDGARYAFVLRRQTENRALQLYDDPFMERVDQIIVPHAEHEFAPRLPERLRSRTTFVGTIARRPDAAVVQHLRSQRCAAEGFLLTSTVGGGGFIQQADRFFELVAAASERLAATIPGFHHVVVLGPNYGNRSMIERLVALPNTQVVQSEHRMVELLAASDLVIAEAGYNTVSEISLVRVPAILVPSERSIDDQRERATRLAERGAVEVIDPLTEPSIFADLVQALAASPERRLRMRSAAQPPNLGNDRAADIIAVLANARSRAPR